MSVFIAPIPAATPSHSPKSSSPIPGIDEKVVYAKHLIETDPHQVLIFPLHEDYLITQSTLFRSLLSTTPHPHLDFALPQPSPSPFKAQLRAESMSDPRGPLTGGLSVPGGFAATQKLVSRRGAKVLPTKQGEAVSVYVPIPDPGSFGVIVHWLYW